MPKTIYSVCQNPICGIELLAKRDKNGKLRRDNKKYCSRSCSATMSNIGRQRNFASHGRPAKKPCGYCGKITTNPIYCSSTCDGESRRIYTVEEAKRVKNFRSVFYRMQKKKATPKWVDKEAIMEIYLARPDGYDVDHMIPIIGRYIMHEDKLTREVCGLHVPWNLQHMKRPENGSKSNKLLDEYALLAQ